MRTIRICVIIMVRWNGRGGGQVWSDIFIAMPLRYSRFGSPAFAMCDEIRMNDVWLGSLLVLGTVLFYLSMPQQNWRAVPLNRIPARLGAAVCLWLALRLALVDHGAGAAFAICMVTAMMAWISYPLLGCLVHRLLKRALCP